MTIPLLEVFEKVKARLLPGRRVAAPVQPPSSMAKAEGDKLAKTVLPNSIRTLTPEPSSAPAGASVAAGPRMVTMGRTPAPLAHDLPPAVALALEPRVERVLSLVLEDVIGEMPAGYLKPRESFDTGRRVLLKAAEIEKGLAAGRPTIPINTVYQQIPEIFLHAVPPSDASLISLPFDKLMNELAKLRVRQDQTVEQVLPQVETPFLQVTLEDTQRFGLPMEPITTAELPPVRMEFATAETIAAAEPDVVTAEKIKRPIPKPDSPPVSLKSRTVEQAPLVAAQDAAQTEIRQPAIASLPLSSPAQSSTNHTSTTSRFGTGEPAFPRVPASSGPPAPVVSPVAPIRIPFRPASEPTQTASGPTERQVHSTESAASVAPASAMVTLDLRPILESVPPMQLAGDLSSVAEDTKISFPFSLIAPQLATGKVAIRPKDFYAALPPAFRELFLPEAVEVPVALPLSDVLANLPGEALRIRDDQEICTQVEVFETPFSTKAEEDAQRFANQQPAAASGGSVEPKEPKPSLKIDEALKPEPFQDSGTRHEDIKGKEAPPTPAPKSQAKEAVARACALSGVSSCSVIFSDGLSIAGNIPEELHVEGLSAVAPTLLHKLTKHMLDSELGALRCVTVHGEKTPVTFFTATNICLTAIHGKGEFTPDTRDALAEITRDLSNTYSQPETANVNH